MLSDCGLLRRRRVVWKECTSKTLILIYKTTRRYVPKPVILISAQQEPQISRILYTTYVLITKQDRQCTYNATMRRVRAIIVAVEGIITYSQSVLWPSVSSTQSACAVLHCRLSAVQLYHIFPHYFINGTIKKNAIDIKRLF